MQKDNFSGFGHENICSTNSVESGEEEREKKINYRRSDIMQTFSALTNSIVTNTRFSYIF
jgi:hypothetical protein